MKTAFQVSWPCGYRLYVRKPLRLALRALRSEMNELGAGDLHDRIEDITTDGLGPWDLAEAHDAPMLGDAS